LQRRLARIVSVWAVTQSGGTGMARTLRDAAIWGGVTVVLFLLWIMRGALLLAFGAILLSILLQLMTDVICRLRLPRSGALLVSTLLVIGIVALCFWLFGSHVAAQFHGVVGRIKDGWSQVQDFLHGNGLNLPPFRMEGMLSGNAIPGLVSFGLNFAEGIVIIVVMAIYLAAEPPMYRKGIATLIPSKYRDEGMQALHLVGSSLKLWLMGQLILMLLVSVLTYIALLIIGLPDPLALALIAGLAEAVPYLGPFIGGVPAILVALTLGVAPALWTVALYLGVHLFEGYLVGPVLQRWFVRIPPALILGTFFAAQLLFGFFGVVLAAPLAVALFAAVKVLYVRDTLGERADLPEHAPF
jgi:predicted PurR-regulated permease PerM